MRKMIKYLLAALALAACDSKREDCSLLSSGQLTLWPVNASFKLPAYKIADSLSYGKETILTYDIASIDSLITVRASVISLEESPPRPIAWDINQKMVFQKKEVEYGRQVKKLTEEIMDRDSVRIGYLKYLVEQPGEKFYEGRVFFRRGNKAVEIWLFEKYKDEQQNARSVIDCIKNSIELN